MNEIEEWFLNEFVDWGFSLSPMIFNPEDFSPCRMVLWEDQNGRTMNTGIKITPDLATDVNHHYLNAVLEYRQLIIGHINRFLLENGKKDFKPRKKLNKLKL
jgi:hypothetical protein